jgi:predicted nucleic acid-binding protein
MMILVDTCIWSYALRNTGSYDDVSASHRAELIELINETRVCIVGPVRQEILSGIKSVAQFAALRDKLREFPDTAIITEDYETAARLFNSCRSKGIQGSNVDFLLCAVSCRLDYPIYTTDKDFTLFSKHMPIKLYSPRSLEYL